MKAEYLKTGGIYFLKSAVENKTIDELKKDFPNEDETILQSLAIEKPDKKAKKEEGEGAK